MNFQPLKDFMDGYLPMLGVPGTDIAIYKDHEEIFRYQSGYDSLEKKTPVNPNALYHMYSITKVLYPKIASILNRGLRVGYGGFLAFTRQSFIRLFPIPFLAERFDENFSRLRGG